MICSQYQALTTSGDSCLHMQQCKSTTTENPSEELDPGFIFPKRIFKLLCNTIQITTVSILNARCLIFKPGTPQISYTMSSIQKKSYSKNGSANQIVSTHTDFAFDSFFPCFRQQKNLNCFLTDTEQEEINTKWPLLMTNMTVT